MRAAFRIAIPVGMITLGAALAGASLLQPSSSDEVELGCARVGADCDPVVGAIAGTPKCGLKASACAGRTSYSACIINTWNTACANEQQYTPGGTTNIFTKSISCTGIWYEGWCAWDAHSNDCYWRTTSNVFWCPGGRIAGWNSQTDCNTYVPAPLPGNDPSYHPPGI